MRAPSLGKCKDYLSVFLHKDSEKVDKIVQCSLYLIGYPEYCLHTRFTHYRVLSFNMVGQGAAPEAGQRFRVD